jgi:phage-related protein (TIGR01555 family)
MKKIFKKFLRNDSWINRSTNLGVASSRTNNTIYSPTLTLSKHTLEGLYNDDGISQRIVESVVADSLKGFINAEAELLEELKRIQAKQKIYEAGTFGRLYGGALLIAFVDDGQELLQPLDQKRIHKIVSLQIYDRHQVSFEDKDVCQDIYSEHFGKAEIYKISQPKQGYQTDEEYFEVHHSRCFIFGGKHLSTTAKLHNNGWDGSVLQACYNSIRNYGIVNNSSVEIVQDFVQPILKMSGLSDKASSGELDAVKRRLEVIDRSRSSQNTIMLDSEGGEKYSKLPSTVSGLSDLWEKFSENICATTGIPASRLFGKSPSGLNSSGENDLKNWHDIVGSYREDQIEPCLTWLLEILQNQHSWNNKPATFNWTFPALHNPSELELAEIKKKYAEIDIMYADRGGIEISEAWQERFGNGEFQIDIQLSTPDHEDDGIYQGADIKDN